MRRTAATVRIRAMATVAVLVAVFTAGGASASTELGVAIRLRFVGSCGATEGFWYTTSRLPDANADEPSLTPLRWRSGAQIQLDGIGPSNPDTPLYFVLVAADRATLLFIGRFDVVRTDAGIYFELDARLDCSSTPYGEVATTEGAWLNWLLIAMAAGIATASVAAFLGFRPGRLRS